MLRQAAAEAVYWLHHRTGCISEATADAIMHQILRPAMSEHDRIQADLLLQYRNIVDAQRRQRHRRPPLRLLIRRHAAPLSIFLQFLVCCCLVCRYPLLPRPPAPLLRHPASIEPCRPAICFSATASLHPHLAWLSQRASDRPLVWLSTILCPHCRPHGAILPTLPEWPPVGERMSVTVSPVTLSRSDLIASAGHEQHSGQFTPAWKSLYDIRGRYQGLTTALERFVAFHRDLGRNRIQSVSTETKANLRPLLHQRHTYQWSFLALLDELLPRQLKGALEMRTARLDVLLALNGVVADLRDIANMETAIIDDTNHIWSMIRDIRGSNMSLNNATEAGNLGTGSKRGNRSKNAGHYVQHGVPLYPDITALLGYIQRSMQLGVSPDGSACSRAPDTTDAYRLPDSCPTTWQSTLQDLKHIHLLLDFVEMNVFVVEQYAKALVFAANFTVTYLANANDFDGSEIQIANLNGFLASRRPGITAFAQRFALYASKQWTFLHVDTMEELLSSRCGRVDWKGCFASQVPPRQSSPIKKLLTRACSQPDRKTAGPAAELSAADYPWQHFRNHTALNRNFFPVPYDNDPNDAFRYFTGAKGRADTFHDRHNKQHIRPLADTGFLADWKMFKRPSNGKECLAIAEFWPGTLEKLERAVAEGDSEGVAGQVLCIDGLEIEGMDVKEEAEEAEAPDKDGEDESWGTSDTARQPKLADGVGRKKVAFAEKWIEEQRLVAQSRQTVAPGWED